MMKPTLVALTLCFFTACTQDESMERARVHKDEDAGACFRLVKKDEQKNYNLSLVDGNLLVSGDVLVGRVPVDSEGLQLSLGMIENFTGGGKPWTNGKIPYAFEAGASSAFKNSVNSAISAANNLVKPTIELVARTNENNYVLFKSVSGTLSTSFIGMIGGAQEFRLAGGFTQAIFFHELGHAIGLFHEQQRWDRDEFLKVTEANIPADLKNQVDKVLGDTVGAFDFASIMLYDSCGGYTPTGCAKPWYVKKADNKQIRAPQTYSAQDIDTIKYLYKPAAAVDARKLMPPQVALFDASRAIFSITAMPDDTTETAIAYAFADGFWTAKDRPDIPAFTYGGEGHVPVPGNYYGDTADEQAVFFAAKHKWIAGEQTYEWPAADVTGEFVPVPFRYSGGDYLEPAVFNRANGHWLIKGQGEVTWADKKETDIPMPGNYGTERGKIAWFNPLTGYYGFFANKEKVRVGLPDGKPTPVVGDFDGDGKDDPGIFYFDTGKFSFHSSKTKKVMTADTNMNGKFPIASDFDKTGKVSLRFFNTALQGTEFDLMANAAEEAVAPLSDDDDDQDPLDLADENGDDGDKLSGDALDSGDLSGDESGKKKKKKNDDYIEKTSCDDDA